MKSHLSSRQKHATNKISLKKQSITPQQSNQPSQQFIQCNMHHGSPGLLLGSSGLMLGSQQINSNVVPRRNSLTITRAPQRNNSGTKGVNAHNNNMVQNFAYQSSKQIKSVSKYTINRYQYNCSQSTNRNNKNIPCTNIYQHGKNMSSGVNNGSSNNSHSHKKNIKQYAINVNVKNYSRSSRHKNNNKRIELDNQKTQKFQKHPNPGFLMFNGHNGLGSYLQLDQYQYIQMIGKGGFGKVWKVMHMATQSIYAMKEMSKSIVITKRSIESIINQRLLLSQLSHQFLVNMLYAFQDNTNLYLIMPLKQNGDLRYHIAKKYRFKQQQVRFIVAVLVEALEYMHKKMVIHRDVKPENIVFDEDGYPNLTDLGIAKYIRQQNYQDTSGTPGYMAPEVMFHYNHRYQVDYYAIGVILYELMMGTRPYLGKSRQQIKQQILKKQVYISKQQIPQDWTIQSADFVNKLLQRKPIRRLGWGGAQQLKDHRWLRNFPFEQLKNKTIKSPFKGKYNVQQVRYRATEFQTQFKKLLNKNTQMLERGNLQDYFEGYTYNWDDDSRKVSQQYNQQLVDEQQTAGLQFSKSTFLH